MKDSTRAELHESLAREDLTIEELVARAEELLPGLAPRQTRYKVSERPDIRTIRYYTSQALLPKPVGYEGGRARYSGTHLARLLLIKRMQAEHHTLQQIARALHGASDEDVMRMLLADAGREQAEAQAPGRSATLAAPPLGLVPAGAVAAAPASAAVPAHGTRFRRFVVAPDASLDVPEAVLDDPGRREVLASSLESLARMLRKSAQGEDP